MTTLALYSVVEAVGNGDYLTVAVPEYIDKAHIFVIVDGLPRTDFEWVTDRSISILAGLNSTILVVRRSSIGHRLTQYIDGVELPASTLELDSRQAFYMAQEAYDLARLNSGNANGGSSALGLTAEQIKALLKNQLDLSHLDPVVAAMVQQIRDPIDVTGSVAWRIAQEAAARASAIADEALARATALLATKVEIKAMVDTEVAERQAVDAARAAALAGLQAAGDSTLATLQTEIRTRTDADSALADQITVVGAKLGPMQALTYELLESLVDRQKAQARRTQGLRADFEQANLSTKAAIVAEQLARVSATDALAQQITTLTANLTSAQSTLNAAITAEQTARANADTALGTRIDTVTATVNSNQTTLNAAVQAEQTARANADTALGTRIDTVTATVNSNQTTLNAAVQAEQTARTNADTALGTMIDTVVASVTTEANTRASAVQSEQTARVSADTALGTRIDTVVASLNTETTDRIAVVSAEQTARVNGDSANATAISTLQASTTTDLNTLKSFVVTLDESLATARETLALRIQVIQSAFEAGNLELASQVIQEQIARSTAVDTQAQTITALQSSFNNTTTTTTNRLNGLDATAAAITGDLNTTKAAVTALQTTTTSLSSQLLAEQQTRSTADATNASAITAMQSSANSLGTRVSAVETSATTSANTLGVVTANYTMKVQARSDGKYTFAGIGLNATSSGTVTQSDLVFMADKITFVPSAAMYNAVPTALFTLGLVNGVSTMSLNPVTVGDKTLEARMIVDGGIEARHMTLSDNTNLCSNGAGVSTSGWDAGVTSVGTGGGWNTAWWGPLGSGSDTALAFNFRDAMFGPKFPVKAGDSFACSMLSVPTGGGASLIKFTVGVVVYNAAGSPVAWFPGAVRYAGQFDGQPSSGVANVTVSGYARVWVQLDTFANETGISGRQHYATDIRVVRRFGGELVVDGGITANHIDTRGLSIKDANGNVILASGVPLPTSYAAAGTLNTDVVDGSNVVYNSDLGQGRLATWFNTVNADVGLNLSADWQLAPAGSVGTNVGWCNQTVNTGNANNCFEAATEPFPVEGGARMFATAYTGAHRCAVHLFAYFFDASGTPCGNSFTGTAAMTNNMEQAGGRALQSYKRLLNIMDVPTAATSARLILRKMETVSGQSNSWMFYTRLACNKVGATATLPGPWAPSGLANPTNVSAVNPITSGNASTYIANAAIGAAQVGVLTAGNLTVTALSNTVNGGLSSGGRVDIQSNKIQVYDASNVMRVKLGYLL